MISLIFDGCVLLLCAACPLNCRDCALHETANDYATCTQCYGSYHLMDFTEAGKCFRTC